MASRRPRRTQLTHSDNSGTWLSQSLMQVCFGAAGVLTLTQLNLPAGMQSAIASLRPQQSIASPVSSDSQQLSQALSTYFINSETLMRRCPWMANVLDQYSAPQ